LSEPKPQGEPVTIKKYANRRLYNTATSSYVTLDHLCAMVKEGRDFVVHDAKTGEDITRAVLTQIIFEEEGKGGHSMLPIRFLRQLIRFYGDSLQTALPSYLEMSMEAFSKNQNKMREMVTEAFSGKIGIQAFEEMAQRNMAMMDRTMRMFSPFAATAAKAADTPDAAAKPPAEIDALRGQIEAMQRQLDELAKRK